MCQPDPLKSGPLQMLPSAEGASCPLQATDPTWTSPVGNSRAMPTSEQNQTLPSAPRASLPGRIPWALGNSLSTPSVVIRAIDPGAPPDTMNQRSLCSPAMIEAGLVAFGTEYCVRL